MPTAFSLNYIITSGSEEPDAYVLEYAAIFNCRFVEQIVTPVVLHVSLLSGTAIHINTHTQTLGMRELSGSRTRIHNISVKDGRKEIQHENYFKLFVLHCDFSVKPSAHKALF